MIENYRIWATAQEQWNCETESSVLFDTVAVHLAFSFAYLHMRKMGIRVDDRRFTAPDDTARKINVAIAWQDLDAFEDYLVKRMLGRTL